MFSLSYCACEHRAQSITQISFQKTFCADCHQEFKVVNQSYCCRCAAAFPVCLIQTRCKQSAFNSRRCLFQHTEQFVNSLQTQLEQSRLQEAELLGAMKEMQDKVLDLEKVSWQRPLQCESETAVTFWEPKPHQALGFSSEQQLFFACPLLCKPKHCCPLRRKSDIFIRQMFRH